MEKYGGENKLIAEFMGATYSNYADGSKGIILPGHGVLQAGVGGLEYHNNWNWLMKVVERIESMKSEHNGYYGVYISSNSCTIQDTMLFNVAVGAYYDESTLDTKLDSTYACVVRFIEWYNENKKNEDITERGSDTE